MWCITISWRLWVCQKRTNGTHTETAWNPPETGQPYILVLNESLLMGGALDHTLVNPNQLCHYGTRFQDNLMPENSLSIITEYRDFILELLMVGAILFSNTHTTYDKQLQKFPHINLRSSHPWYTMKVFFQNDLYHCRRKLEGCNI